MLIRGMVVSGRGKGRFFITRREYLVQVEQIMGFTPFPGTLNIQVAATYLSDFRDLRRATGIELAGFTDDGRTYGPVKGFPCRIGSYQQCAVVIPEKSRYQDIMEIIALDNLRTLFGLQDGDSLTVVVVGAAATVN